MQQTLATGCRTTNYAIDISALQWLPLCAVVLCAVVVCAIVQTQHPALTSRGAALQQHIEGQQPLLHQLPATSHSPEAPGYADAAQQLKPAHRSRRTTTPHSQ
jgi:hypothetical protein